MKKKQRLPGDLCRAAVILKIGVIAVALAGCQRTEQPESRVTPQAFAVAPQPFGDGHTMQGARPVANGKFAYSHELSIAVAPRWVAAHFERAKSLCEQEMTPRCVLLDASTNANAAGPSHPSAQLQVRLPHESVAQFVKTVTAAVEGENQSDVLVMRSATRLVDLDQPLADNKRRREQLDDYRNRLKALETRADTRVEDLIKIANELSQTQSRIEEIDEQRRRMEERVDTELVSVAIQTETSAGGPLAPIERVWRSNADILGASAAEALRFALMILPWSPLIVLAWGLLRWVGGSWRRRARNN